MRKFILLFLLLAISAPAMAATFALGDPFPLTNTRYGTTSGEPLLTTNGTDLVLFWKSGAYVRVTRLVDGERRGGRAVLEAPNAFTAIWTGTRFLVVTPVQRGAAFDIIGRFVSAHGEPLGDAFTILTEATNPRLAVRGGTLLLLAQHAENVRAHKLDAAGQVLASHTVYRDVPTTSALAAYGNGFAVLLTTADGVLVARLDGDGKLLDRTPVGTLSAGSQPGTAMATDGTNAVAVWSDPPSGALTALRILGNGTIETPLNIESHDGAIATMGRVSVVWTGSSWAISYPGMRGFTDRFLRVTYVDADIRRNLGEQDAVGANASPAMLGGRTLLARAATNGMIVLRELPLDPAATDEVVSYAASSQVLLATASSDDALLVVWRESADGQTALHAGIRERDGHWSERQIGSGAASSFNLAAAGDGGFLVTSGTTGHFLDHRGRLLDTVTLPFVATGLTWNGSEYVLVGPKKGVLTAQKVSPSGVLSPLVQFPIDFMTDSARIAFDGTNYFLMWGIQEPCPVLCIESGPLLGQLLGPELQLLGNPIELGGRTPGEVVFDGTDTVAVVPDEDGLTAVRVSKAGTIRSRIAVPASGYVMQTHAVPVAGGVAVAWRLFDDNKVGAAFVTSGGAQTLPMTDRVQLSTPVLAGALPDARFAALFTRPQLDAPHHGSSRIHMA
ncbi:MAG: hypothetical protein ACLGH0_09615, partial [Thermoanaerobaculia bacterium]